MPTDGGERGGICTAFLAAPSCSGQPALGAQYVLLMATLKLCQALQGFTLPSSNPFYSVNMYLSVTYYV